MASFAAGRRGRGTSSPPQFGQTLCSLISAQSAQKVHSKEQMRAFVASGGRSTSQHSHDGRNCSMLAPGASVRRMYTATLAALSLPPCPAAHFRLPTGHLSRAGAERGPRLLSLSAPAASALRLAPLRLAAGVSLEGVARVGTLPTQPGQQARRRIGEQEQRAKQFVLTHVHLFVCA